MILIKFFKFLIKRFLPFNILDCYDFRYLIPILKYINHIISKVECFFIFFWLSSNFFKKLNGPIILLKVLKWFWEVQNEQVVLINIIYGLTRRLWFIFIIVIFIFFIFFIKIVSEIFFFPILILLEMHLTLYVLAHFLSYCVIHVERVY